MYANLRTKKSGLINNFSQKNNPHSSRARVEKIQLILEITVIKIGKYLYDVYPFPLFRVHIGWILSVMCTQNRQIGYIYIRFPNL